MSNVYIIELKHLASQAFAMTQQENPYSSRFISLAKLDRLGKEVVGILKRQGKNATLFLCKELTKSFFQENHDLFRKVKMGGENGVVLKQDVPFGFWWNNSQSLTTSAGPFKLLALSWTLWSPFLKRKGTC